MTSQDSRVHLSIKPDGSIEIDCPPEHFSAAIEKTKELAQALNLANAKQPAKPADVVLDAEDVPASNKPKGKKARTLGGSSGRTGRIGSFEEVKGLLTEEQEIALRGFMQGLNLAEQKDEVLVAMYKGEELLGRKGFSYNEVYTLMWLGGIKELPKALDQVLRDMIGEQLIVRSDKGFEVKFVGRARVEKDLQKVKEAPGG